MTDLVATQCPVCCSDSNDRQLYEANFRLEGIDQRIFTPRRLPDQVHYRMVSCRRCGLIRANPILNNTLIDSFYVSSHGRDHELDQHAADTYMRYFQLCRSSLDLRSKILEVGCGSGIFLKKLLKNKFNNIDGVEPSVEAVSQMEEMKGLIKNAIFGPDLYPDGYFDCICAFQVFDHLINPRQFSHDCSQYLKAGGELFLITHDIGAWSAQLLGRSCPMIDIAHPFLYNKKTLTTLLEANGFEVQKSFRIVNRYPLKYWVHLMPLAAVFKKPLLAYLQKSSLGKILLAFSAGNIGIIARKKDE